MTGRAKTDTGPRWRDPENLEKRRAYNKLTDARRRSKPEFKLQQREYYRLRNAIPEVRAKHQRYQHERRLNSDPIDSLVYDAKRRAKNRGRPFSCTVEYVRNVWPVDGKCPYCHSKLERHTMHAPSLDETIIGHGYVVGNVRVICRLCNTHKNNHPREWFEIIAADMAVQHGGKDNG